ncbi:MAG: hypothetical protein JEZ12_18335 [Desulfobacterium sp.]|nr:hypothetical protein [Desulfobacterium sp.]
MRQQQKAGPQFMPHKQLFVIIQPNNDAVGKNIDDLHGLKIGGIIKFSYGEEFDKAEDSGKLNVQRVSTDVQNIKKLLAGRFHIYPQEINVGFYTYQ